MRRASSVTAVDLRAECNAFEIWGGESGPASGSQEGNAAPRAHCEGPLPKSTAVVLPPLTTTPTRSPGSGR